jgi:hypothetical protein
MNIWLSPRGQAGHTARIWVQVNHHEQFDIDHLAVVSVLGWTDGQHRAVAQPDAGGVMARYIATNTLISFGPDGRSAPISAISVRHSVAWGEPS